MSRRATADHDLRPLVAAADQADLCRQPGVALHHGKPTLMVRIGNGRAAVLADAMARVNDVHEREIFRRVPRLPVQQLPARRLGERRLAR
jgi:hypothetical protein